MIIDSTVNKTEQLCDLHIKCNINIFQDHELDGIIMKNWNDGLKSSSLITEQPGYSRKVNGKYVIPENSMQISSNTFVNKAMCRGEGNGIKIESRACSWVYDVLCFRTPWDGLSHGVFRKV